MAMHIMLEAVEINCTDGKSLTATLNTTNNNPIRIHLTGNNYEITQPILISVMLLLLQKRNQ
ncbi:MAG: hypothetical protein WDM90_04510 [Ferruginibacter sp.]